MSEAETKSEKGPFGSVAVFVIGGFIGLVALVYATALLKKPPQGPVQELPHAVVMVEFETLGNSAVRSSLIKLQQDLEALGLATMGPRDYPILVPGGELPTPKALESLTEEDYVLAEPWLRAGGWLVPRIYGPDLDSAVIRLAPKDRGPFPSGTATRILKLLEEFEATSGAANTTAVYSRALGLDEEAARSKINVDFGVQTANVRLIASEEGKLWDEGLLKQIHSAVPTNPRVRSATTFVNFALYATAVMRKIENPEPDMIEWGSVRTLAHLSGGTGLVSKDGKMAWLEVATDAEGEANLSITTAMAAPLPAPPGVRVDVPRKRK